MAAGRDVGRHPLPGAGGGNGEPNHCPTRKDGASSGGVGWWKTARTERLTMALGEGTNGGPVGATLPKSPGSRDAEVPEAAVGGD